MKHFRVSDSVRAPVSHDPGLTKAVLVDEPISCIRRISTIELKPGDTASEHAHPDDYEVFYCLRGRITFNTPSSSVTLTSGDVLVIEPGEAHSIAVVDEPSRLLYMHVASKQSKP